MPIHAPKIGVFGDIPTYYQLFEQNLKGPHAPDTCTGWFVVNLHTKFEVATSTDYKDVKADAECT